jgi:predicted small lipoprotein YifL
MTPSTPLRRALPLVALLAVVGSAAACGQAGPSGTATPAAGASPGGAATSPAAPDSTDPTDGAASSGAGASASGHGVRLEATFAIGFPEQPTDPGVRKKPGVVVTYTLTREGGGAGELVAYDVVPDSLGSAGLPPDVNPEHAWVYANGDAVRISKQGFASAPGTTFVAAPTIGARLVPADGSLQGRAYAVSPAELDVPGAEFTAPRGPLPAGSSTWEFCVQVGERLPGTRPSGVHQGVLEAPVRAPEGDELVCTPTVTLAAPRS